MDLRHQSSAICIIMLGGEDTPVFGKENRPHTSHYPSIPVTKKNKQQPTHTSHYSSRPVEVVFAAMI